MSTSEPFDIHISTADARRDQQDIVRVSAVYTIARDDYLTSINRLTAALTDRFDDVMRERGDLAAEVDRLRAENDALRAAAEEPAEKSGFDKLGDIDAVTEENAVLLRRIDSLSGTCDVLRDSINRALKLSTPVTRDALLRALAGPESEDGEVQPWRH